MKTKNKFIKYRLHFIKDNQTDFFDLSGKNNQSIQKILGVEMSKRGITWLVNKMQSERIN